MFNVYKEYKDVDNKIAMEGVAKVQASRGKPALAKKLRPKQPNNLLAELSSDSESLASR